MVDSLRRLSAAVGPARREVVAGHRSCTVTDVADTTSRTHAHDDLQHHDWTKTVSKLNKNKM